MIKKQQRKKGTNKGKPKQNNRHAYGLGHGKFGKKTDRIKRMQERIANGIKRTEEVKRDKTVYHYAQAT